MLPKKLLDALRKKQNKVFLVSAHINLEGDALGSELALASLLKRLGKKVIVLNQDEPPVEYGFLPGLGSIRHNVILYDYDVGALVDCSDISRIGKAAKAFRKDRLLLNIDHHISNTMFADVNWVKPNASCASEMVYELFKALSVKINKAEALCLYTGILADTGSFKYSSTSSFTHLAASELLKHNLDVNGIYRHIHESLDVRTVKALGKVIETLKIARKGKLAWLEVKNGLIKKEPALAEMTDEIIHFARAIKGVEVALLFKEIKAGREVRVNLRSRGKVDVNGLASFFGGGGHKMASGCTMKGSLKDAVNRFTTEARRRIQ
ncbi:MAG: bifunctional oligoribonuclease/PAP phosphatase NrnA [Candidatus Omnitrophica bacterium CG_4_10_14_0_8_um_filter_44_12]|nr:MAG: bifunctional oligoribonuclease/PAP phosphatase NrnA [Candidatus Omnitrophica bacterium CG_4_10_14_0_8_um_filter_44_12]